MSWILDSLATIPAPAAYALVGGLAFGEAVFLLGFILPGETAVVLGGVIASQGRVSLPVMIAIVASGAVLGDSLSYEIGRRFGPGLLSRPWFARREQSVHAVKRLMARWGALAVVAGRFTAYIRPLVPALAGAVGMPYRRFLVANAVGAVTWAAAFSALGYGLGDAYSKATGPVQWGSLGVLVFGAAGMVVVHWHHRHSSNRHLLLTTSPHPVDSEASRDIPSIEMIDAESPSRCRADVGDCSQPGESSTTLPQAHALTSQELILSPERSLLHLAPGPCVEIWSIR